MELNKENEWKEELKNHLKAICNMRKNEMIEIGLFKRMSKIKKHKRVIRGEGYMSSGT